MGRARTGIAVSISLLSRGAGRGQRGRALPGKRDPMHRLRANDFRMLIVSAGLLLPSIARAEGHLRRPDTVTPMGSFSPVETCQSEGGTACSAQAPIAYLKYEGLFE